MSVKKLYLATCMKDLEEKIEINPNLKQRSTNLLASSAEKIFKQAQECLLARDEEKAYMFYVRFVELLLHLKKQPDFGKHAKSRYLVECAATAITKAEVLKESLLKRYSIVSDAIKENEKNNILTIVPKTAPVAIGQVNNTLDNVPDITPEKPKDEEKLSISSSDLHSLLTSGLSVIIMDTRSRNDFATSHIKYSQCISVPQEILIPGLTAVKLESTLPSESLAHWYKRKDADHIILVDWDSSDESTQNIHLNSLKTAMSKWDQNCVLKKPPMILKGGYKDWMMRYPMFTTQALSFDQVNDIKSVAVIADLSGIEYPNLDDSNDEVQILNKKNSSDMLFKKSPMPETILNGVFPPTKYSDTKKPYSAPTVDRKSKPSIDTSRKASNVDVRPSKILSHSANNRKNSPTNLDVKLPPPVDRKLKDAISNPVSDTVDKNSNVKDNALESFNKEQSLAKESVEIINQKLRNEVEFEKLCLRKELEAEESKRIEIQKQEEILIETVKQLEIQRKEKEKELLKVKEENRKFMKILEEKLDTEYKKEKEKDIDPYIKEQLALRDTVEKLREERKRNENLKKKEFQLPVPRETASANSALRKPENASNNSPGASEYTVPLSRQTSADGSSQGLVRSHSSPNIAQMVNEEECAQRKIPLIKHTRPSVNRSLKPKVTVNSQFEISRARLRNLNPVYGNCPGRPATGLRNLGNTCFMNAVIQCLSNTKPLADYINSGQYEDDICRSNKQGTGGELIEEFAVVIRTLWMGQYKSFYPKDFKNTVSRCLPVCIGNEQQDSHEFLVVLMEKLHADLKRKCKKSILKLEDNYDESTFWPYYKANNNSKIAETFDGLLKSTLTCLSCKKKSDSFEVFSCLSLPILSSRCSLKECIEHFLKPEKISGEAAWDCPRCKQKKEAEKRLRICRPPDVLIIQLKRFSYEGLWRRKLQTHVDFDLNFELHCESRVTFYTEYSLYGIVNHYGTLEGGHYTAYCKTSDGKWFKYDDHEVSEISSSDIKTSAAYLLFYSISSNYSTGDYW